MKHSSEASDMDRSVYITLCICLVSFAVISYSH